MFAQSVTGLLVLREEGESLERTPSLEARRWGFANAYHGVLMAHEAHVNRCGHQQRSAKGVLLSVHATHRVIVMHFFFCACMLETVGSKSSFNSRDSSAGREGRQSRSL